MMAPASSFQSSGSRRSIVDTFMIFVACATVYAGFAKVRAAAVGVCVVAVGTAGEDTPPKVGAPALYFWTMDDRPPNEVFDAEVVRPVGACCCRAVTGWGRAGAAGCIVAGGNAC